MAFLQVARRRISPGGIFLWADVFRGSGEDLAAYLERYVARIRRGWHSLSPEQQEQTIAHLRSCDIPADRGAIEAAASAAGWQCAGPGKANTGPRRWRC